MRVFFALLFQSPGHMVRCRIWSVIRASQTSVHLFQSNTTIGALFPVSIRLSFLFPYNKSVFGEKKG